MVKSDNIFKSFKGKNVLVTGHTGFKGSWLSIWLKELGANVIGFALDPYTKKDNFEICGLSNKITDIRGDVRDVASLEEVFKKYQPEIVFHLAAQPIVLESYKFPKDTFDINVGGIVNVLDQCKNHPSVRVIINITSDKCYDNKEWIWGYRENDPIGGFDPYSASKGCSEIVTSSFTNSFFHPDKYTEHNTALSSVRAGNVIGGGDWAENRIIPDCIRSLETDVPIFVRNPIATRPWQHVLDALSGYLYLAEKMIHDPIKYQGPWNFGPENISIVPVKNLVEVLIKAYGKGSWHTEENNDKLHEASMLSLDISKAYFKLGWKPTLLFEDTVKFTADWYKNYRNNNDMYSFCVGQIQTFMQNIHYTNGIY